MQHHIEPIYETFTLLIGSRTESGCAITSVPSMAGNDIELHDAFSHIATGTVDAILTDLGAVGNVDQHLCIRLHNAAPHPAALHWASICNAEEHLHLVIAPKNALVCYVPMRRPVHPAVVNLPLLVLLALVNPSVFSALDVAPVRRAWSHALAGFMEQGRVAWLVFEHVMAHGPQQVTHHIQPCVFRVWQEQNELGQIVESASRDTQPSALITMRRMSNFVRNSPHDLWASMIESERITNGDNQGRAPHDPTQPLSLVAQQDLRKHEYLPHYIGHSFSFQLPSQYQQTHNCTNEYPRWMSRICCRLAPIASEPTNARREPCRYDTNVTQSHLLNL